MGEAFVHDTQIFLLIFVRTLALTQTAPLLSSRSIPQTVKASLAFFTAFALLSFLKDGWYEIPEIELHYILLVIGEAMLGIITGYLMALVLTVFQLAGQYLSLQMGFSAAQVFDPVSQIQVPLMGQFINMIAIFIFISVGGFQRIYLVGVFRSFQALRAIDLVRLREPLLETILVNLTRLFEQAMIIAFPIVGILILVYVAIGLVAKAAPQMNLLILGFPLSIGVGFLMLFLLLPILVEKFIEIFDSAFRLLLELYRGGSYQGATVG